MNDVMENEVAQDILFGQNDGHFRAIVEQSTDGVAIADMEGHYLFVNSAFCKMVGYSEAELLEMTVFDVKASNQPHSSFFDSKSAMEGLPLQVNLKRKDNSEIMSEIVGTLITVDSKQYVLGTVRLIYDRQLADFITRQKNQELEDVITTKDKFFSIISHDLRSPLATMILLNMSMQNYINDNNIVNIAKCAKDIKRLADSTYTLLENLLDWSRIQQGLIKPIIKKVNVFHIIYEVESLLIESAKNKGIKISNFCNQDNYVNCDDWIVKTILRNLVSNAIKFSPKNGTIRIVSNINNNMLEIEVHDEGMGIPLEHINNVFSITNNPQRKGTEGEKGTGIGLALCKELVNIHGGTITVKSEVDKGTSFYVNIPV